MSSSTLQIAPMQWAKLKDIDDTEPLNEGDFECMREVREVLKKHGKRERFGVALLHKHFDVAADEMLVETTDRVNRVLMIETVKAKTAGNTIQTIWQLNDGDTLQPMMGCMQYCGRDVQDNHNSFHKRTPDY